MKHAFLIIGLMVTMVGFFSQQANEAYGKPVQIRSRVVKIGSLLNAKGYYVFIHGDMTDSSTQIRKIS